MYVSTAAWLSASISYSPAFLLAKDRRKKQSGKIHFQYLHSVYPNRSAKAILSILYGALSMQRKDHLGPSVNDDARWVTAQDSLCC